MSSLSYSWLEASGLFLGRQTIMFQQTAQQQLEITWFYSYFGPLGLGPEHSKLLDTEHSIVPNAVIVNNVVDYDQKSGKITCSHSVHLYVIKINGSSPNETLASEKKKVLLLTKFLLYAKFLFGNRLSQSWQRIGCWAACLVGQGFISHCWLKPAQSMASEGHHE